MEALAGAHPFSPATQPTALGLMCDIVQHTSLPMPPGLSAQAADWLARALAKDPGARATAGELLAHPWVACRGGGGEGGGGGGEQGSLPSPRASGGGGGGGERAQRPQQQVLEEAKQQQGPAAAAAQLARSQQPGDQQQQQQQQARQTQQRQQPMWQKRQQQGPDCQAIGVAAGGAPMLRCGSEVSVQSSCRLDGSMRSRGTGSGNFMAGDSWET
jgi:hypothetical protein